MRADFEYGLWFEGAGKVIDGTPVAGIDCSGLITDLQFIKLFLHRGPFAGQFQRSDIGNVGAEVLYGAELDG